MKSKTRNIFILYFVTTLVCCLMCFIAVSAEISLKQAIEQQLNKEALEHKFTENVNIKSALSRKRRYLEFPEGSSFQLVYDLIIGVVDFTNYLILGVTVALAWELPSKPPSEIFEDFYERLQDGTLGTTRNDTVENIKYVDIKSKPILSSANKYKLQPMFRPPMHYKYYYSHGTPDISYNYHNNKPLYSYNPNGYNSKYYTTKHINPFLKWTQPKYQLNNSLKGIKYPWWNLTERLKNSLLSKPNIRKFDQHLNKSSTSLSKKKPIKTYKNFPGTGRSEHRIYPVFGKRSISNQPLKNNSTHTRLKRNGITTKDLSKLDRIHIDQHRKTRHDLYQRIETYLNGRGSHGHHCVLRALCETGQKSNEHKPGSFVGELMRAIFTLPEPLDNKHDGRLDIGYKEQRYDVANALRLNCAKRYINCKDSLWTSHFVI